MSPTFSPLLHVYSMFPLPRDHSGSLYLKPHLSFYLVSFVAFYFYVVFVFCSLLASFTWLINFMKGGIFTCSVYFYILITLPVTLPTPNRYLLSKSIRKIHSISFKRHELDCGHRREGAGKALISPGSPQEPCS